MRNKVASIVIAGALACGVAAPAPAVAVTASSQQTVEAFTQDPVAAIQSFLGLIVAAPVILSTMGSSLFGEQCNLFDTRGCHEG